MKRILYGPTGRTDVREGRAATDAADWTPDNLSAGEISGGVVADDVTFEAHGWDEIRVGAIFSGSPGGTETVTVQPLRELRDPSSPSGRVWVDEGSTIALAPTGDISDALPVLANAAFRITALTLGGATDVAIFVTGGRRSRPRS